MTLDKSLDLTKFVRTKQKLQNVQSLKNNYSKFRASRSPTLIQNHSNESLSTLQYYNTLQRTPFQNYPHPTLQNYPSWTCRLFPLTSHVLSSFFLKRHWRWFCRWRICHWRLVGNCGYGIKELGLCSVLVSLTKAVTSDLSEFYRGSTRELQWILAKNSIKTKMFRKMSIMMMILFRDITLCFVYYMRPILQ